MSTTPVAPAAASPGQAAGAASSSRSSSALTGLSDNFDNFLKLLTKQLQNQDPLAPMDANQFTQQLVQFTAVEQAIATNSKLDKLIEGQAASQAATALSYLGMQVTAKADQIGLTDGEARFDYTLAAPANSVAIVISDSRGKPVLAATGETAAGTHSFTWDGKDADGTTLPDGTYKLQVVALDADGKLIDTTATTGGKVTGVEIRDGQIVLSVGDLEVPFDQVLSVRPDDSGFL
ncbi:MAG: flagellar hook assembly protein FlgD [Rhodospirillaceae bacterium]|nr:flagellar hook assembly protein FlgD [Rhodospirillaceae bacterium]